MEFGIIPPVRTGATADPDWMASFAHHVESAGFESLVLVEHAVVISDYTSTYPYAPSGRMPLPDDCRIPDPLDLMAFLAAVTDRITLATGVLVVPNHQAVVLAKRIATVDVLSKGRVRMCLGVGWMDEELRATGADPRTRPAHGRDDRGHAGAVGRLRAGGRVVRRRVRVLRPCPLVPQAVPPRRRAAPHRRPQRGRGPPGRPVGRRLPTTRPRSRRPRPPGGPDAGVSRTCGPRPRRNRVVGVGVPAHDHRGGGGDSRGRRHPSDAPVDVDEPDLDGLADEVSAFAERFGPLS